ncbi:MAG: ATP-binding protein [Litorivicinus sp.]
MIDRNLLADVFQRLKKRPAVVLLGPRQVGKTTLAHAVMNDVSGVYLDLESPSDQAKLDDPELYFSERHDGLTVIDEVQRQPELFPILRGEIDRRRRAGQVAGQFLLLGSASHALLAQSSESLAGRVAYLELTPILANEVSATDLLDLWVRGGFPEAFLDADESFDWRLDFIRTYLERDLPALGVRIPAAQMRRFWTMLAHHQGQTFNASQIGGSLDLSGQTARSYLDLLTDLMLVRALTPWSANVGKRLVKTPKVYVRDTGLVHALLGIRSLDELLGHPVVGASWEGFVIENLIAAAPSHASAHFYRTHGGAEIDLLLSIDDELWAIEIKRSLSPKLSKGFFVACEDLGATHRFLVYSGDDSYPMAKGVTVIGLAGLTQRLGQLP